MEESKRQIEGILNYHTDLARYEAYRKAFGSEQDNLLTFEQWTVQQARIGDTQALLVGAAHFLMRLDPAKVAAALQVDEARARELLSQSDPLSPTQV